MGLDCESAITLIGPRCKCSNVSYGAISDGDDGNGNQRNIRCLATCTQEEEGVVHVHFLHYRLLPRYSYDYKGTVTIATENICPCHSNYLHFFPP